MKWVGNSMHSCRNLGGDRKNTILFTSNKTAKSWQKGLNVQQESTCAFNLLPWDFSPPVEMLGTCSVVHSHLARRVAPGEEVSQHVQAGHGLSPWQDRVLLRAGCPSLQDDKGRK